MLAQKGLRLGMGREGTGVATAAPADEEAKRGDDEILKKPIGDLELSVRSRNCMERLNIKSIGDLTSRSEAELLAVKNFGTTSLAEIKQRLGELGLTLRQDGSATAAPGLPGLPASLLEDLPPELFPVGASIVPKTATPDPRSTPCHVVPITDPPLSRKIALITLKGQSLLPTAQRLAQWCRELLAD